MCSVRLAILSGLLLLCAACGGGSEPARVTLPLFAHGTAFTAFTTDEGYEVTLAPVTLPLADLALTGPGEAHARGSTPPPREGHAQPSPLPLGARQSPGVRAGFLAIALNLLLPTAHAHPGHETGGAVLGERQGDFDARFGGGADKPLGEATLLEGAFRGANVRARAETVVLRGEAAKDGTVHPFELEVPVESPTRIDGIIFELDVTPDTRGRLVLSLKPVSSRGRTLFDTVDFAALGDDAQLTAARNAIRRALVDHAHYALNLEEVQ